MFVGVDVFHAPRKFDPKAGRRLAKESVAAVIVQIIRSHSPSDNSLVEIYCETETRLAGKEMELGSVSRCFCCADSDVPNDSASMTEIYFVKPHKTGHGTDCEQCAQGL